MDLSGNSQLNYCRGLCFFLLVNLFSGELNAAGERFLAARGGLGGSLATNFLPCKGQSRIVRLDLKLIADVGLVG